MRTGTLRVSFLPFQCYSDSFSFIFIIFWSPDRTNQSFLELNSAEIIADYSEFVKFGGWSIVFSRMREDFEHWLDRPDSLDDQFQTAKKMDSCFWRLKAYPKKLTFALKKSGARKADHYVVEHRGLNLVFVGVHFCRNHGHHQLRSQRLKSDNSMKKGLKLLCDETDRRGSREARFCLLLDSFSELFTCFWIDQKYVGRFASDRSVVNFHYAKNGWAQRN